MLPAQWGEFLHFKHVKPDLHARGPA